MAHTLIICEKPSAAKAIAEALGEDKPVKFGEKAVWYEFENNGKKFISVPAVGHLFTLKQVGKGWNYPVFDVEWIPSFKATRSAAFTEEYFKNIEKLSKDATNFIVATDYDDEGEVIGYNILRFLCKKNDAKRMKFSTMTKEELLESFAKPEKKLNKNLVEAGLTRHYLDFFWGISMTRALTNAIKVANKRFRILSTGRVQGPTLHMLSKHEKKIKAFIPKKFWQIEADIKVGKNILKAEYEKDKIWDKKTASSVLRKSKAKSAKVDDIKTKLMKQKAPKPYNTTSFLSDVYRYFGYAPTQGLNIAESLYQKGYISYPRTASEKLPPDINYRKILRALGKQEQYTKDVNFLIAKKDLTPEEGKKIDPAHPALYPTGVVPKRISAQQKRVYDLIVRRFMSTFGEPAKRESQKIKLNINGNTFFISGRRTVEAGWTALYGKYSQREEILLPNIKKGDTFEVKSVNEVAKETQPPARFSQGSVLKEMEEKGLGTKSTRAQILNILYNRGYIIGRSIEVTELGTSLSNILEKNVKDIVSENLTKHFEEMTEAIAFGNANKEQVLDEVKQRLSKICNGFRKKEKKIGEELTKAVISAQDKQSKLGPCPECRKKYGGTIKVFKIWKTGKRFAGCTGYKKGCRFGAPLPREGLIMSTGKTCEQCKTPIIQVQRQGARPFRMCISLDCPTKDDWKDESKLAINIKKKAEDKKELKKEDKKETPEKSSPKKIKAKPKKLKKVKAKKKIKTKPKKKK
ncbi:DNA topoisomerase I [Candidatus Aenigmatarchaeota archaeon]